MDREAEHHRERVRVAIGREHVARPEAEQDPDRTGSWRDAQPKRRTDRGTVIGRAGHRTNERLQAGVRGMDVRGDEANTDTDLSEWATAAPGARVLDPDRRGLHRHMLVGA